MAHADHYAILIAINYYPGLHDLGGPENDIEAFRQWLMEVNGGDMDSQHIQVIRSSDYARVLDPNDANPTERAFIAALDKWVRDADRAWRNHVGERLYIYMAGHGFTAGSTITDPALFSAVAQNGDTAHIAGYRYASKIVNAGFFDEVVLIMDCCQDVLKASQVLEPTWTPPDRNRAAVVKLFQAYGAPRGQSAYEEEVTPGVKRGFFSQILMKALATARPDSQGFVSGLTLKNQFLQLWGDSYKAQTGYDPPIRLPDGEDIRFCPRNTAALVTGGVQPVTFALKEPAPQGAQLNVTNGAAGQPVVSMPATDLQPQKLEPGLYKVVLTGTTRASLFEVTGAEPVTVSM